MYFLLIFALVKFCLVCGSCAGRQQLCVQHTGTQAWNLPKEHQSSYLGSNKGILYEGKDLEKYSS